VWGPRFAERWGERAVVFSTDEGLIWIPDYFRLRSVSPLRNEGERCSQPGCSIQGQVWTWDPCFAVLDDAWLGRLLTQTAAVTMTPEHQLRLA